jgi:hypothetical protein
VTGQLIWLAIGILGVILIIWAARQPPRSVLRRRMRKALRASERDKLRPLPRTNGQGSRYGNRRVFRGKTRKMRPAPPSPDGGSDER